MQFRSQDDFFEGINGAPGAPRALSWVDLRSAFDVNLEVGDNAELVSHRITVMMRTGNYYFCVEQPDDVPVWLDCLRRVIQDAHWLSINAKDTEIHRRKRWPAAVGIADALWMRGAPVGERALAILFHAYDMDYDCFLRVGELMVLIRELQAAIVHCEGHVEGRERDTAVMHARSRMSEDEVFDRAMVLRKQLSPYRDGLVRKDDFIRSAAAALDQAVGGSMLLSDLGGHVGEVASGFASWLPF